MQAFLVVIRSILSKSLTAIKGTINIEELWKVILTASAAGGSVWTVLTAIHDGIGTIVTDPTTLKEINSIFSMYSNKNYIGLTFFVGALLIDFYRRINQGVDITPSIPSIKELNKLPVVNPNAVIHKDPRIV